MSQDLPTLYSFRRCPYAIRARLAIASAGVRLELREISLKNKHEAFLQVSPSGTVPCLKSNELVLDESLEIMVWALKLSDPERWLDMPAEGWTLIEQFDGPFKAALDRTKYAVRFAESDPQAERAKAHEMLSKLDSKMGDWIFERASVADFAILPFVRQFAFIEKPLFDAQPWPQLHAWLEAFLASERFAAVMQKRPFWEQTDTPVIFPETRL